MYGVFVISVGDMVFLKHYAIHSFIKEPHTSKKAERDVEKDYSVKQIMAKLRRLANCLESDKPFTIQVAGERIRVSATAVFNVEHKRDSQDEELEFQFKWAN